MFQALLKLKKSRYIFERIKNDLNPHFMINPVDCLFATLSYIKATAPKNYYSYGIRYLEKVSYSCEKLKGFPVFPVTVSTDGELTSLHSYSHSCDKLRYIMNQLLWLFYNSSIHYWKSEYLNVADGFLLMHLNNPHASIIFKKMLTLTLYAITQW